MTITTSYPGVYITEDSAPPLSVSSRPTAVPIFATSAWSSTAVRINNYKEFIDSLGDGDADRDENTRSLRAYFEHGGGPCYRVNASQLISEVPKYPDITLIVAGGKNITDAVAALCTDGSGLFAIMDGPKTEIADGSAASAYTATPFAAVYYPWATASWSSPNTIPPSAIAAGLYCANDRSRGVWKAPANMPLAAGYQPQFKVTDDLQGQYNTDKAINMIRTLPNKGPTVMGARTLDDSDDWRYIPVRRLFNSAEWDIQQAMQAMVFETNHAPTWEKVRTAITNYLHNLWQQGALAGSTVKEAYFVKIGEDETMSSEDIAQGKMIVQIGMAAVRPAEFIILQFTQNVAVG